MAAAKKQPAKGKQASKAAQRKRTAKKKIATKDLLHKQFGWPQGAIQASGGAEAVETPTLPEAPPFVAAGTEEEAERMRNLLFKKFDPSSSEQDANPSEAASGAMATTMATDTRDRMLRYNRGNRPFSCPDCGNRPVVCMSKRAGSSFYRCRSCDFRWEVKG